MYCCRCPLLQFLTVEEPVRMKCRTVSLTDPKSVVRGFQLHPSCVDFGTMKVGTCSTITVIMKNVGVDTCRYSIKPFQLKKISIIVTSLLLCLDLDSWIQTPTRLFAIIYLLNLFDQYLHKFLVKSFISTLWMTFPHSVWSLKIQPKMESPSTLVCRYLWFISICRRQVPCETTSCQHWPPSHLQFWSCECPSKTFIYFRLFPTEWVWFLFTKGNTLSVVLCFTFWSIKTWDCLM